MFLLSSCSTSTKKGSENTLKLSFNTYPTTSDPRLAADFISSTLVCLTYDGLTRCLPGGSVENALAERIELSADQLVYTFHIRKANWSDGKPITAYDFEKSWKDILSPAKPCAFLFYPIKNAEGCVKGRNSIDEVGIFALDDSTLRVELERPTPYFRSLTAFPSFLAAPAHTKENSNVQSGPFLIKKAAEGREIILKKNKSYWNRLNVFLDQIDIHIVPDEMTAFQMFERGDLDWLGGPLCPLPPDVLDDIQERLIYVPNAASTICTFNTQRFPFNNKNIRRAFAYSINRREIVEKITGSGQIPATSILPPSFSKNAFHLTDVEKAKECFTKGLEELGINREDFEELVLHYRPSQVEKRLAQTLERQWKNTLGIQIKLEATDYKSHAYRLQTKNYQIALASWIAQFDDPISILGRFKDGSNLKNYPGFENPTFQHLLDTANLSPNREEVLARAEVILEEEMPLCPIYHWSSPAIHTSRIESIATTPSGGVLFERFSLKKR